MIKQLDSRPLRAKDGDLHVQERALISLNYLLKSLMTAADQTRSTELNKTAKHTAPARALVYSLARAWSLKLNKPPPKSKGATFWRFCQAIGQELGVTISEDPFTETTAAFNEFHNKSRESENTTPN